MILVWIWLYWDFWKKSNRLTMSFGIAWIIRSMNSTMIMFFDMHIGLSTPTIPATQVQIKLTPEHTLSSARSLTRESRRPSQTNHGSSCLQLGWSPRKSQFNLLSRCPFKSTMLTPPSLLTFSLVWFIKFCKSKSLFKMISCCKWCLIVLIYSASPFKSSLGRGQTWFSCIILVNMIFIGL